MIFELILNGLTEYEKIRHRETNLPLLEQNSFPS